MGDWKEQLRKIKRAMLGEPPTESGKGDNRSGHHKKRARKHSKTRHESNRIDVDNKPAADASNIPNKRKETSKGVLKGDTRPPVSTAGGSSPATKAMPREQETEAPVFRPRIELKRPLTMPNWSDTGRSLQHPDHSGTGAPMSVRIGIDFGTAFTKVAIRAGVDLVLVEWSVVTGDDSAVGRYVIPGFVCRTHEGEYGWQCTERTDLHGNLKLPVIENATAADCPTAALAFLALVIRYARAYLYRHTEVGRKLATRTLRWELNIGCPTEPHERPEAVAKFQKIARTAWALAETTSLRETDIASAWRDTSGDVGLETEPGVIPEFVAQIAGYLQSPQVNDGLHALVDIGAATVDIATFNVVLPNDSDSLPKIPIFFSTVKPLGTHYLSYNRYSRLGMELVWDDDAPVEEAEMLAIRTGRNRKEIDVLDTEFVDRVSRCIINVIEGTRNNRRGDPRSRTWIGGLPLFVTGGGAACELYRRAIGKSEEKIKRNIGTNSRFRLIELDSLGVASDLFGRETGIRTSVSIGLTEDADSIARVVPHRDIEPITYSRVERVDHTEIYSD